MTALLILRSVLGSNSHTWAPSIRMFYARDGTLHIAWSSLFPTANLRIWNNNNSKSMSVAYSFVCKQAVGKVFRLHALNDTVAKAISSAGIPVAKELDGKRPDRTTLIPCKVGKPVIWDVTATCTTAVLHWFLRLPGSCSSRNCSYAEDGQIQQRVTSAHFI